jgi:hypothetical protein
MWTVCQNSSKIAKVNIATGHTERFKTGPNPYTYSDFTGFLRATITSPEGHYIRLHDAALSCTGDQKAVWSQLYFDVETPVGTRVDFWGRTAETLVDLPLAPEFLIASAPAYTSPTDVEGAMASAMIKNRQRFFEVRVALRTQNRAVSPVFRAMRMVHYCACACDVDNSCSDGCACDTNC